MAHRATITPTRELALANRTVKHARDVLGFLRDNPAAGTALARFRVALNHRWLLRFGLAERARALARIRLAARPAHYALWMCIHRSEGAWYSTNPNGHYNGLQMTLDWGEGIVGNPNNYTPMEIMAAAERGYVHARAQGRLRAWLQGQWGQTIGPCWGYA
jgi:hypothetical protein